MALTMQRVQVWTGEIPDRPGAAAGLLAVLAKAGADLAFIFTQPVPGKPELTALSQRRFKALRKSMPPNVPVWRRQGSWPCFAYRGPIG